MEESISHSLFKKKLMSVKNQAKRKCWTEMCRKVDGRSEEADKKKKKGEAPVLHPYSNNCFQVFIQ